MAKESTKDVGTWIIRTDGTSGNEHPKDRAQSAFFSINGRNRELKLNEPFKPTKEELEILQASYYNINGQLQRYDADAVAKLDKERAEKAPLDDGAPVAA